MIKNGSTMIKNGSTNPKHKKSWVQINESSIPQHPQK